MENNWGKNKPVVVDEFGYIATSWQDTESVRRFMWSVVMHDGFVTTGDWHTESGATTTDAKYACWHAGDWYNVQPDYNYVKFLVNFWTSKDFWKIARHNELVVSGSRTYLKVDPSVKTVPARK